MKSRQAGFTLIELIVGVTIFAILCGIAAPSFRQYTRETRTSAAQSDLVSALSLARSESLRRSMPVAICASTDGAVCSGGNDWSNGWIVFTDSTGVAGTLDGTDLLLQGWGGYAPELVLNGNNALSSVRYQPNGMIDAAATAVLAVSTEGCTGTRARTVSIAIAGGVSSEKTSC